MTSPSHTHKTQLNLVVIRSSNIEQSVNFYQQLGLTFAKHRHANGLEHYACELGTITFEIYPLASEGFPTVSTRIGFRVFCVDSIVCELEKHGVLIVSPVLDSVWGRRAVVADPDGHRVELTQFEGS